MSYHVLLEWEDWKPMIPCLGFRQGILYLPVVVEGLSGMFQVKEKERGIIGVCICNEHFGG